MNRLDTKQRAAILGLMVEGMSLRAITRTADISINTATKLLRDLGAVCFDHMDRTFRNLHCRRLQVDEIWSFVYAKDKNLPKAKAAPEGAGSCWTWTCIDAETKLIPTFAIGPRDVGTATDFVRDIADRLAGRVQITSDGLKAYVEAVEDAFGTDVDFAQLVKVYGSSGRADDEQRYSPAICTGAHKVAITGAPDMDHVSTSYMERSNLSIRMGNRRFTRLTNAFSKRLENHFHALAIFFAQYNLCRIHKTLRVTPAMAAGVADHIWELEEIVGLLEAFEAQK